MFLCASEGCLFLLLYNIPGCNYSLFISLLLLRFVYVLVLLLLIVLLRTFWFIFWWTYIHSSVRSLPRNGTVSHSGYDMFTVSQCCWGCVTEWVCVLSSDLVHCELLYWMHMFLLKWMIFMLCILLCFLLFFPLRIKICACYYVNIESIAPNCSLPCDDE